MVEIFVLFGLCANIRKTAHERKRKAAWFIVMTIVLWLSFEAAFIFFLNLVLIPRIEFLRNISNYIVFIGFLGGLAGGWIAYLIVSNCKIGTYEAPGGPYITSSRTELPESAEITVPSTIKIIREKSFVGCAVSNTLILNGEEIKLRNGETAIRETTTAQNIIDFKSSYFRGLSGKPLYFNVTEGQEAEIHIKSGSFVHKKHKGIIFNLI